MYSNDNPKFKLTRKGYDGVWSDVRHGCGIDFFDHRLKNDEKLQVFMCIHENVYNGEGIWIDFDETMKNDFEDRWKDYLDLCDDYHQRHRRGLPEW